ncbi:MAG: UDP-N-acetylglucosamine 2-epimerase (non-hydrolyzing) [Gammaproteobacteria bacterium]|nr:UDP-N-acetylglucosamine 2-epimerase (non-hydrolyzing) [Gammaproteobacteria bacterium]
MTRSDRPLRLLCIVGARPNFMKIAPLMRVFRARPDRFDARLVHTGQHYDEAMKDAFFRQLHIPEPDIDLGVGSGSHAVQTAEIMRRFEPVLDDLQPDVVLVVGDVNSTIACALVATKKGIAVVHVEAGLRSGDRGMPEEINRVLTDQISDLLFTTEADGATNLMREGIAADRIHFVGNVMIDTLLANRERAVPAGETLGGIAGFAGDPAGFGVLTLHRPSNVDDPVVLRRLLEVLAQLSERLPLVFPIHPRTRGRIADAGLSPVLAASRIALTDPLGYLQLLGLMAKARIVLTDSGGLQEETTALGIPCVTLRENTERPITVEQGTNTIVGTDPAKIRACFDDVMASGGKSGRVPELWDGQAAERIADTLLAWAGSRAEAA